MNEHRELSSARTMRERRKESRLTRGSCRVNLIIQTDKMARDSPVIRYNPIVSRYNNTRVLLRCILFTPRHRRSWRTISIPDRRDARTIILAR